MAKLKMNQHVLNKNADLLKKSAYWEQSYARSAYFTVCEICSAAYTNDLQIRNATRDLLQTITLSCRKIFNEN